MSSDQPSHVGVSTSFAAVALSLSTPAAMHPALAETPCDTASELFIETTVSLEGTDGAVTFHLAGAIGQQQFTFASGTWQGDIIAAINSFVASTGIEAEQSAENSERVRVLSVLAGNDAFVSVTQVGGNAPLLYEVAVNGQAGWRFIAHGEDGIVGDADCDGVVGTLDLIAVIDQWGACPKPPAPCVGDVDLSGAVDVDDLIAVIMNWT